MFSKTLTVLNSRCMHKQSCSVLATTNMFDDPCPGTHKYLEAHYQCQSAAQTSTTTNRPSPPWLLTNTPPLLANGSRLINPAALPPPRLPALPSSPGPPTLHTTLPGGRIKGGGFTANMTKNANRHDGLPPPPPLHHHHHTNHNHGGNGATGGHESSAVNKQVDNVDGGALSPPSGNGNGIRTTPKAIAPTIGSTATPDNTRILTGVGGTGGDDGTMLLAKNAQNRANQHLASSSSSSSSVGGITTAPTLQQSSSTLGGGNFTGTIRNINNINNINAGMVGDDEKANLFCGSTNARNLFWNVTRVGDVNVQPCPGGATGIAKWHCVLMKRITDAMDDDYNATDTPLMNRVSSQAECVAGNSSNCEVPAMLANKLNNRIRNFEPTWHPMTPDLTQCRSLWLNNLEVRVNQRDSSIISIANDLSEVTSSKTLYGGDMLVTTKIIQTMSEKMFHDKETYPDQRQREAMILELLHCVVKTGSNLLDDTQLPSWLDLNQEDQMRVATSLLTGLEYNAFLLADTIIRERNVVQKVKNILLSVRVLETKNIQDNEVFPDTEQWDVSGDRIELPRAALIEHSEGGLVRIVFAAFNRLESILKPSYDNYEMKNDRNYARNGAVLSGNESDLNQDQQRIRILNSKVISASLGKGRHSPLTQAKIKLVLRHLRTENVTNPTCVFWNYIDHTWSENGCNLESTNRTHSVCMCDHLTNFAILMDIMDEHNHSLFTMFDGNMRVFIYVSIAICLLFIVIALLTLKIFNGVFIKSARTSIYRNIYVCLLLVEVLFLIGIEQSGELSIFCGFTTVFLHCAILAAIAWFCFEAFQSYTTLITDDILLEVDQTAKVNCYYLLSYGWSLTVVAISLAINPRTYTQNDFCVLMESNTLFYGSFVTPVLLFLLAAICYTFLSCLIMCRKSRTALKNKEHTRLANVRFDIRCSFIFLLLLSAVWLTAYYYLRLAKMNEKSGILFGYLFVGCNTLMGLYIFVFHCIQNEKIRREYRKYVRQNSWLPKCLRCSKASISSGIVGTGGGGGGGGGGTMIGATGTLGNSGGGVVAGTQLKKSKLPMEGGMLVDKDEAGGMIATGEDAIIPSSDCELNEAQSSRRLAGGSGAGGGSGTLKSGIMPGSLVLQHGKANSIIESMQGHVILERGAASALGGPGASGTLRSNGGGGGVHTPSAGHTSPTSSAGSTHLIFGHGHKQPSAAVGAMSAPPPGEAYYHQPDFYGWKHPPNGGSGGKAGGREYFGHNGGSPQQHSLLQQQQQPHEIFYWTQKHNHQHGNNKKKNRGSGMGSDSPSGSLHSRTTAASQILFYPSYKKTTVKQQQSHQYQQPYGHYSDAIDPGYYQPQLQHQQQQQQQQSHRRQHQQQPQYAQQLSSDEESAAHAHLLHLNRRTGGPPAHAYQSAEFGGGGGGGYQASAAQQQQRYFNRNKHSNCDLSNGGGGGGVEAYYNQGSLSGGDGPVYEEILSNRNSDVQHYDVGGVGMEHGRADDDYEDDERVRAIYESEQCGGGYAGEHMVAAAFDAKKGARTAAAARHQRNNKARQMQMNDADDDDDDDDGNEDDDDEDDNKGLESVCDDDDAENDEDIDDDDDDVSLENTAQLAFQQSDERMRRLMAMQDEDFQRRFQRQLKRNGESAYHDYDLQQQHPANTAAVFDISGGSGGSIRNFNKKTSATAAATSAPSTNQSPSHRLAVNELFAQGPPLPPANQQQQHSMQKRQYQQQQQQQQQLSSPQSITSATSTSSHLNAHHQLPALLQQQPPVGRNISAMLDENNTVRCYLEPISKLNQAK